MNHDVNCSVLKKLSDRALKECGFNTKPVKLNTITIYRHKLQTGGGVVYCGYTTVYSTLFQC